MALPWDESDWLAEITAWTGTNARLTGPIQVVHRRAWSALLLAPTANGSLYVKATAPSSRHEVGLTRLLAAYEPGLTVELVAADAERGWLLMHDAGESLRERLARDDDLAAVERLYRRYGELQRDLSDRTDLLLGLGTPDRRLARIPELAAAIGADAGLVARLVAVTRACPLPDTLVHEEIHDANLVVRRTDSRDDLVIIDWADSCVGHPFFGVVVGLRSLGDRLGLQPGAPALQRLVDSYLGAWTDLAPADDLRAVFGSAYRLGMLNRALSWSEWDDGFDEAARVEYGHNAGAWLQEFADADDPLPGT